MRGGVMDVSWERLGGLLGCLGRLLGRLGDQEPGESLFWNRLGAVLEALRTGLDPTWAPKAALKSSKHRCKNRS